MMQQRMTRKQIDELKSELDKMFPWIVTYGHLECFGRVYELGMRAVHDLRTLRHVPLETESANLRQPEEIAQ